MSRYDVIVIGAGIVGAGAAAALGATHRVALVEAEEQAGYHTPAAPPRSGSIITGRPKCGCLPGCRAIFS